MSIDNILSSPALAGMRALNQWIVYQVTPDPKKPGKLAKLPVHYSTGRPCSVVDPANWGDAATAAASAKAWGASYGVGFCFTAADPYWFVDLDSCLQPDGTWSPLAQQIVGQVLPGAALEISASGKGLHLFGRGSVPPHASKNIDHHAELYTEGRFCALTGTSLQGDCDLDLTPGITWAVQAYFPPKITGVDVPSEGPCAEWRGPTDNTELLRRAMQSRSAAAMFGGGNATFSDLWLADETVLGRCYPHDTEPFDRSSADAALASHLAFWCGKDQARIAELMQQSKLAREKYERPDYLPRTISNACSVQRDVLQDKLPEPPPQAPTPPAPPAAPGAVPTPPAAIRREVGLVEGSTFLSPAEQVAFFQGCTYVQDQHRVLLPGGALITPDRFRARFGGYTYVMDGRNEKVTRNAFEAFTESQAIRAPRADSTCFKPALPFGQIIEAGGQYLVNTFVPAKIARRHGDVGPFLQHLAKLIPDEYERNVVLYYMACCVQRAGYKAQWTVVIQGCEGNGKSFLSSCLQEAIGQQYTFWPRAEKLGAQFNGWLVGKLIYIIEELMTHGRQELMDVLKPLITSTGGIEIERKGQDQFSAEICGNFWCTTNHKNAVLKTRNDRRWCMVQTAQQDVADMTRDGTAGQYMPNLYAWAKAGGYAVVAEYLHTVQIPPEFDFSKKLQRAPETRSTQLAISDSLGPVEQEVFDAVEREEVGFRGGWISSGFLDKLLVRIGKDRYVSINKRRDLLAALGYVWHPSLLDGRVNNPVLPDSAKVKLFVAANRPDLMALSRPAEVAAAYTKAQSVEGAGSPPAR